MGRLRKLITLIGGRGVGKTTTIIEIAKSNKEKVLILDFNAEVKYSQFPTIGIQDIGTFTGIAKIHVTDFKTFLKYINLFYRNGLLILEDANAYLPTNKDANKDWWNILVSMRHKGIDCICTYHSVARVPPYLYEMVNDIILFKTSENPERMKNKIPNFDEVFRVWLRLKASNNRYEKKLINIM